MDRSTAAEPDYRQAAGIATTASRKRAPSLPEGRVPAPDLRNPLQPSSARSGPELRWPQGAFPRNIIDTFGRWKVPTTQLALAYRANSRAITLLKGASAGGSAPQALAPAVQSCSAAEALFSAASLYDGGRRPFANNLRAVSISCFRSAGSAAEQLFSASRTAAST